MTNSGHPASHRPEESARVRGSGDHERLSAGERRRERKLRRQKQDGNGNNAGPSAGQAVTASTPTFAGNQSDVALQSTNQVAGSGWCQVDDDSPAVGQETAVDMTLDQTLSEIETRYGDLAQAGGEAYGQVRDAALCETVETLERAVAEKDQLITALTDRLEQAAEQLDRLRRSGADRGWRGAGGGGMPQELIQDQRTAIEDLKATLGRWEEMQAGMALGRMEMQLGELRDLVISLSSGNRQTGRQTSPPMTAGGHGTSVTAVAHPTGNVSWWERQKAALLNGDSDEPEEATSEPEPAYASSTEYVAGVADGAAVNALLDFVVPECPAAVDPETFTTEAAWTAIAERDRIIEQLREPILIARMAGIFSSGIGSRASLPAEQEQRLAQLEAAWEGRFRQQEMELSIERARLAREQMTLRQMQEAAQKELHRLKDGPSGQTAESRQERRWFRFMNVADQGKKSS